MFLNLFSFFISEKKIIFIYFREDRNNGDDKAENHVEADKKLVKAARVCCISEVAAVEIEEIADGDACHHENGECGEDESGKPAFLVALVVRIFHVLNRPRVYPISEVDEKHQLDENKGESADQTEYVHHLVEGLRRDEEGGGDEAREDEKLDAPKAVLNSRARVFRGSRAKHQDHEEPEKAAHAEANAVGRLKADEPGAVDRALGSGARTDAAVDGGGEVGDAVVARALAEHWHFTQRVFQPVRAHDHSEDRAQKHE